MMASSRLSHWACTGNAAARTAHRDTAFKKTKYDFSDKSDLPSMPSAVQAFPVEFELA
jgi:hypothetical protein